MGDGANFEVEISGTWQLPFRTADGALRLTDGLGEGAAGDPMISDDVLIELLDEEPTRIRSTFAIDRWTHPFDTDADAAYADACLHHDRSGRDRIERFEPSGPDVVADEDEVGLVDEARRIPAHLHGRCSGVSPAAAGTVPPRRVEIQYSNEAEVLRRNEARDDGWRTSDGARIARRG